MTLIATERDLADVRWAWRKCPTCRGTGALPTGNHSQDWCWDCGGARWFATPILPSMATARLSARLGAALREVRP